MITLFHRGRAAHCRLTGPIVAAACVAGWLWGAAIAEAGEAHQASTSREARQDAVQAIPFEKLQPGDRQAVEGVIRSSSIYRRLPTQVIDCDPQMFLFLVQHPELVVNMWEVMQISDVSLQRTGPSTFRASDGDGTSGNVKLLYSMYDKHLIYAEGSYAGSLVVRPVQASCVLLLRSAFLRETNGRQYVTCKLDAFVHLDRAGIELLAKTLQPLMGRAADYNFSETMTFVSSLSRTAEINPYGTAKIAQRLTKVQPEVRNQLVALSQQLAARAEKDKQLRTARQAGAQQP